MRRTTTTILLAGGALALLAATAPAAPILPDFSAATFPDPTTIDNPYFPLVPGTTFTYLGSKTEDGETIVEKIVTRVGWSTRTVAGIESVVVRDRAYENDLLVEDTFDWYAQDDDGIVWYLGEFSTAFEFDDDGNLVGSDHDGSWEAGVDGALPGWVMPAASTVGLAYYQEFAPANDAVDEAEVLALGESVSIGYGSFTGVLRNEETTVLEPDVLEHKLYAPGLGLILVREDVDEFGDAEFESELVRVQQVPEPASLALLGLGAGILLIARRRRSARR